MTQRRAFSVAAYACRTNTVLFIAHRRLATWLPAGGELMDGETPLEAAVRELREETGIAGVFPRLAGAVEGEPPGLLGYEEHLAGSKGLHMNFVFVADVPEDVEVTPNHEFERWRWLTEDGLGALECPSNAREFGRRALKAKRA